MSADPSTQAIGPQGELTLRTLAMPSDVNVNGDIFGGWVLSQMDMAAGIVAGSRAKGRVATVAIDAMKFIRPVKVGDVLCIYVRIARIGRTSMAMEIEAWVLRNRQELREKVTEALFTFVAIDEAGKPRAVPEA
jgi:acyl-CoA thioesterase YciA